MLVAMVKGKAGTPERFWNKAVAESETELTSLEKDGYVRSPNQPNSRSEAVAWIRR
jgi:hypothetical protein